MRTQYIKKREFLTEIEGDQKLYNILCNFSNSGFLSWGGPIVASYETYIVKKVYLHYVSSSPFTNNNTVYMAFDYDAADDNSYAN